MQKIKSFLIGIIVLALFLCAFTFFIPVHLTVERGAELPVSRDSLQRYLENLPEWPQWCSWMGKDSIVTRTFYPSPDRKANTVIWFPNEQPGNKNTIVIVDTASGKIGLIYHFRGLLPLTGGFTLTDNGRGRTFVVWKLNVTLRWYPWEKLAGIAMDKDWGASMSESLTRLKAIFGDTTPVNEDPTSP